MKDFHSDFDVHDVNTQIHPHNPCIPHNEQWDEDELKEMEAGSKERAKTKNENRILREERRAQGTEGRSKQDDRDSSRPQSEAKEKSFQRKWN